VSVGSQLAWVAAGALARAAEEIRATGEFGAFAARPPVKDWLARCDGTRAGGRRVRFSRPLVQPTGGESVRRAMHRRGGPEDDSWVVHLILTSSLPGFASMPA
jgi:hypothetical protein